MKKKGLSDFFLPIIFSVDQIQPGADTIVVVLTASAVCGACAWPAID